MNLYKKIILVIVFIGYIFMMVAFKKISDWMVLIGFEEGAYEMFAIFLLALIMLTIVSASLIFERAKKKKQSIIKGR